MDREVPPSSSANFVSLLTHSVHAADNALDVSMRRLRKRVGLAGTPKLQPYMGYASKDWIRLHGRVLTNPPIKPDFRANVWWRNLVKSVQRFASDEVPNVRIQASAGGSTGIATSDAEGYFQIDLPRQREGGDELFWSPATLQILDHDSAGLQVPSTTCQVMYVPKEAQFGIISDVDDTIVHTGATSIMTMAKLTFFGNARTRAPLDGVAKLYQWMQIAGASGQLPINPIFYISSSPWNLYDLLADFLELNAIPYGPLLLRDLGFDEDKFLKTGHDHKLEKARELMNWFDDLPFVLFGDSGQEDARLYATAAQEFGSRIKAIFIRDVDPDATTDHDEKVEQYVRQSSSAGVPMHLVRHSEEVAELARRYGLLPVEAEPSIELATIQDRQRDVGILTP